jgi:uncharacterized cupin superfamily protein
VTYLPDPATPSRRADRRSAGRIRSIATGSHTRGDLGLCQVMPPDGSGPGPHLHRTSSESLHVLDGELAVHADGRTAGTAEIDALALRHDRLDLRD